ncbi:MAG TPA: hypothetical protein VGR84_18950 [Candidatus Acidoferrales bacterium]|nr:hypothetical protein [Candidatus Acidoferrales bacterium]
MRFAYRQMTIGPTVSGYVSVISPPTNIGVSFGGPLEANETDIIIVFASVVQAATNLGAPPSITGVSLGGLTFTKRFRASASNFNRVDQPPPQVLSAIANELWYAVVPSELSATMTITWDIAVNPTVDPEPFGTASATFAAFVISGANLDDIWDGVTQSALYPETGPNTIDITTTNAPTMVLGWFSNYSNPVVFGDGGGPGGWGEIPYGAVRGGFTWLASFGDPGHPENFQFNATAGVYQIFATPQAGVTVQPAFTFTLPAEINVTDAVRGYATNTNFTGSLSDLPATASSLLIAGWIGNLPKSVDFAVLTDTSVGGITFSLNSGNNPSTWTFQARQADGTVIVTGTWNSTGTFIYGPGFHSFALSVDTATQTIQFLIDGTLTTFVGNTGGFTWSSSLPVGYSPGDGWQVGGVTPIQNTADLSALWFAPVSFDLSNPTNVAALFGTSNCFVDWGSSGQNVTGMSPPLFMYGMAGTYNNRGTGGTFTRAGPALLDVTPGPIACP